MKKFYAFLFAAAVGFCASSAATMPLSGAGTQANPYQITSAADWNALGVYMVESGDSLLGKYVKIMNDIDFSNDTIVPLGIYQLGTTKVAEMKIGFAGTLLGNNCTISGINYSPTAAYKGMIAYLHEKGEVDDLTMRGTVTGSALFVGGFFGNMNGKAKNCNNYVNVSSTATYAGGFAGNADTSAVFINCNNYGAVTGTKGYIGGFAASGGAGLSFTDCTNYGTITNSGTTSSHKSTGGFVGNGNATTFINCNNRGTIVGSEKGPNVGGLIGYVQNSGQLVFTNCNNYAEVSGGCAVGGLLGSTHTSTAKAKCAIIADNCHNYGAINSYNNNPYGTAGLFGVMTVGSRVTNCHNEGAIHSTKCNYIGGVWGFHMTTTSDTSIIYLDNCYNIADITNEGNFAAGLGSLAANAHMTNCYNTGNVTAAQGAAGLSSAMGHDIYIDKCWNSGDITATNKNAGGLISTCNYRTYVSNCFNTGDVTAATSTAGGVLGTGRVVFTNCYNRGNVTAATYAGGLVGQPNTNVGNPTTYTATSLINCYNAGIVTTDNDTLGGNLVANTKFWNAEKGCVIQDTYYVSDYYGKTCEADSIGGTPITVKELAALTSMAGDWTYGDAYTYPMIQGLENECAQTFAVAVVLADGDTYDNVTTSFTLGEQDAAEWTASTDSILITDYAFIGGPIDKMSQDVVMTASAADGKFQAPWYLTVNAEKAATGIEENELTDRVLTSTMYYDITGAEVTTPAAGNLYIRLNKYNDGTQSASKIRF